jgi:hypothetical protein
MEGVAECGKLWVFRHEEFRLAVETGKNEPWRQYGQAETTLYMRYGGQLGIPWVVGLSAVHIPTDICSPSSFAGIQL